MSTFKLIWSSVSDKKYFEFQTLQMITIYLLGSDYLLSSTSNNIKNQLELSLRSCQNQSGIQQGCVGSIFSNPVRVSGPIFQSGSVRAKNVFIRVFLGSKLLLFGPVSGPLYKGGFDFLGLIIQEIKFLVGFSRVCQRFPAF